MKNTTLELKRATVHFFIVAGASCALLLATVLVAQAQNKTSAARGRTFLTPEQAAAALIDAAEKYDEKALIDILGPDSYDIVHTGEPARDKEMAAQFAAQAKIRQRVTKAARNTKIATLFVGDEDWPFPVPINERQGKWSFNTAAGRREILMRRIGRNELDAIEICRNYVDVQHEYALMKKTAGVNQYAQRIVSTDGQQDALAWKNADGTWGGPLGEEAAAALSKGHQTGQPYHGYFFKVLKGQGPGAPLGELDYVIKGVMIGGFALIASPAQYRNTGVKTFLVSQDGVVYEKDLGPRTLEIFQSIDRFNPDPTWRPVLDKDK
ncbi:MAG TPA: DUF2950 domain-containing protein [Pyrinomonadaceae bacterium]